MKIQNVEQNSDIFLNCTYCNKKFTRKYLFEEHSEKCFERCKSSLESKEKECDELHEKLQCELEFYKNRYDDLQHEMCDLLKEVALSALGCNNSKIEALTKKYVKRQRRVDYKERNVVYILTTELMKKEGRYIMGKAVNLTNRLSTYNKSDEHEVIFYISCDDEDKMNLVENLVFQKLKDFREQANRERFILPSDKNIEYFIDIIRNCVDFV